MEEGTVPRKAPCLHGHQLHLLPDAALQNERAWYNLNLPRESILKLLAPRPPGKVHWYRLFIPSAEMEFTRFDRVRRWEEIAVALLKKYCDRYYKHRKQEWEADHLEYHDLREDDPNFLQEYHLLVDQSAGKHQARSG